MRVVSAAPGRRGRLRAALAAVGAVVLGAAPHVLHHAGPLAGAALLAGASGRVLFGAVGFLAAVPLLRRLRARTGSWRLPAGALALMAAAYTFSSLVIGPALTADDGSASRSAPVPTEPNGRSGGGHETHHP